jgi:hypothetical protein
MEIAVEHKFQNFFETGTVRSGNSMHRSSTMMFCEYIKRFGGELTTVDINPNCRHLAHQVANECGVADKIIILTESSTMSLMLEPGPIDFLYLDSLDFDPDDPEPSQTHNLKEAEYGLPLMSEHGIILIDDCDLPNGGKGGTSIPWLLQHGWKVEMQDYQTLLVRGE